MNWLLFCREEIKIIFFFFKFQNYLCINITNIREPVLNKAISVFRQARKSFLFPTASGKIRNVVTFTSFSTTIVGMLAEYLKESDDVVLFGLGIFFDQSTVFKITIVT